MKSEIKDFSVEYTLLRNSAPEPEVGLPGRIFGRTAVRNDQPEGRCRWLPGTVRALIQKPLRPGQGP